jgi:hypothetical protein
MRVAALLGLLFPLEHISAFLSAAASLHLQAGFVPIYIKLGLCGILVSLSPFFAFWPLFRKRTSASRRMRDVAICCMAWGTADAIFFIGIFLGDNTSLGATFYQYWHITLLELRVFTTVTAVIALLVLFFRSQRVVEQERVLLAGEMQGAREIQGLLVNSTLQVASGLRMEAVFRPAREVGGDFYRCRLLPDGTQRVLLGDVSGKGAAAAMTAAMLLGAAECHESDSHLRFSAISTTPTNTAASAVSRPASVSMSEPMVKPLSPTPANLPPIVMARSYHATQVFGLPGVIIPTSPQTQQGNVLRVAHRLR